MMLYNGLITITDLALRDLQNPFFDRYRDALILGTFREDVCHIPGVNAVLQSPSLTHFYRKGVAGGFIPLLWPGARYRTQHFVRTALEEYRASRFASAFVQLGRAIHPLMDMSCPVHAQSVVHETDPFEWCVEGMRQELMNLPVPAVQDRDSAAAIVEEMALFAQDFKADTTNTGWGRLFKRWGWRTPVDAALGRDQARQLIPKCAGCTSALFRLFLRRTDYLSAMAHDHAIDREAALEETVRSLELSPTGVNRFFRRMLDFCSSHSSDKHYGHLADLMADCVAVHRRVLTTAPVGT